MGHSFGLVNIASAGARLDARQRGSLRSIRQIAIIALGLAAFVILPVSKAAAQGEASAPGGETDVKLLQPKGADQATGPVTVTLQDALERARKLDPTLLGAVWDAKSAREDRIQARNAMLPHDFRDYAIPRHAGKWRKGF